MGKTPDYVKNAVKTYREKYDIVQVRLPKGTKQIIEKHWNVNEFIVGAAMSNLRMGGWIDEYGNEVPQIPDDDPSLDEEICFQIKSEFLPKNSE